MVDFTDNDGIIQAEASRSVTPMKVTAVVVIAIILACIYLLGGVAGAVSLAVQVLVPGAFETNIDIDNPQLQLQMDFQQEINAMSRRFFWLFIAQTVVFTIMGALLLFHGIQALRKDDAVHYRRLGTYLLIAIAVELIGAVLAGVFQYGQWSVIQGLTVPPGAGGQAKFFKSILLFSTIAGIVITWIWQIAKLVYLAIGARVVKNYAAALATSE